MRCSITVNEENQKHMDHPGASDGIADLIRRQGRGGEVSPHFRSNQFGTFAEELKSRSPSFAGWSAFTKDHTNYSSLYLEMSRRRIV